MYPSWNLYRNFACRIHATLFVVLLVTDEFTLILVGDRSRAGVHQVGGGQGVRLQRFVVEDEEVDNLAHFNEQCCDNDKVGDGKCELVSRLRKYTRVAYEDPKDDSFTDNWRRMSKLINSKRHLM